MQTMVTVSSRVIRQPRQVTCRIACKRSLVRRVQHLLESADWEERYLCSPWVDRVCLSITVMAVLYFAPVLAAVLLR